MNQFEPEEEKEFEPEGSKTSLKYRIYEVIFKADTPAGKWFDIGLIICIILSTLTVVLESLQFIKEEYGIYFRLVEWIITILFTVEYVLRIYSIKRPKTYIFSFYGIIDLLAILPTYMSLILVGSQYMVTVRVLRILRIFRVLKLNRYLSESRFLIRALKESRIKVTLFITVVFSAVLILGSVMHFLEGDINEGFNNIPHSIYWAIVTLTTVGYGDVVPVTAIGKILASMLMLLGYAIIAVPTGIVTSEMIKGKNEETSEREQLQQTQIEKKCLHCSLNRHQMDAIYCRRCGTMI